MFDKPVEDTATFLEPHSGTEKTAFQVSNLYTFSKKLIDVSGFDDGRAIVGATTHIPKAYPVVMMRAVFVQ